MNTFFRKSIFQFAFTLTLTLAFSASPSAFAGPMAQAEFLKLVGGDYSSIQPVRKEFFQPEVDARIYEEDGQLYFENNLAQGSKTSPALYKINSFECYDHLPQSTTCSFRMMLLDMGQTVHFLGIQPSVSVNRRSPNVSLDIYPDFRRAEGPVPHTLLEKDKVTQSQR